MPDEKKKIGRYEIRGTLGKGAMGAVYKGWDTRLELDVAIKVLLPGNDETNRTEEITRFLREVKISRNLKHPNIVAVYDVGDDPDTGMPYIVMEFIKGKPLDSLLKERKMTIQEIVTFIAQVADGLDCAAQAGIVHRDIKPANIMVNQETLTPKLVDFGVARIEGTNATQSGTVLGTPHYMSPEQCRGEVVDGRSDLFSLGAMTYEMLTGIKAFQGDTIVNVMMGILDPNTPVPPGDLRPEIPYELSEVVMKALAKDPADRFQRGKEMVEALQSALADAPSATVAIRPGDLAVIDKTILMTVKTAKMAGTTPSARAATKKAQPPSAGVPLQYVGIGVAALLLLGGGAWFMLKPSPVTQAPSSVPAAPSPQAQPAPPSAPVSVTAVQLGVVKEEPSGRIVLLNDGDPLRATDNFAVTVQPDNPSYIYIWQTDSSGEVFRVFPNADFNPQGNPVSSKTEVWLPVAKNKRQWFHLDQNPGEEEIVIVVSADQLQELEDPLGLLSLSGVVDADTKRKIVSDLHRAKAKLSVGKPSQDASRAAQSSSGASPTRSLEGNSKGFYYQVRLKHL
ncbi:MAG: protein kinase [Nitrospirales bacterium]|nr:protein kinase [Nitrospirales bacterium]